MRVFSLCRTMAHVNFIKEIFPLLRVLKFLGWLPTKIAQEGGVISAEWSYSEIGYSIFATLTLLAINFLNVSVGITHVIKNSDQFPFVTYMQTIGTLLANLVPLIFASRIRHICRFLGTLVEVQAELNGGKHPQQMQLDYSSGVKIIVRVGLCICLTFSAFCLLIHQYYNTNFLLYIAVTFGIVNITLADTWWICIFKGVKAVARQSLKKLLECKKSNHDAENELKGFVSMYLKMCTLLEDAGNATAEVMAVILLFGMSAILLFAVYELAGTLHNVEATAFTVFMLAFCSLQTIIVCEVAHSAAHKIQEVGILAMSCYGKLPFKELMDEALEVVLRKIKRPPKVSLSKFIEMDRVLYTQLFPGLFSILMVLLQLNIVVKPLKLVDFFDYTE